MLNQRVNQFIKNPRKALFKLAMPIIIIMLVQSTYNIVDTAFVGRLGAEAIAALTFSFPILFILFAIINGISIGMASRIARFLGEKKEKEAENAAMHGLLISIVSAIILSIISLIFLKQLFNLFGATQAVTNLGIAYMSILLLTTIFMFPYSLMSHIFASQGDTKTPMKIQIIALLTNMILDPIFIYTLKLGVKGAAVATAIAWFVGFVISIYYLHKKSHLKIHPRIFKFSKKITKDIISVGFPTTLTMLVISIYIVFINKFGAHFGTNYIASIGIAFKLESFAMTPMFAFSSAILTLSGMFYGAKKYKILKDTVKYGLKITIFFTLILGALLFSFPHIFLRIFTPDKILVSLGTAFLQIEIFNLPFIAVTMLAGRALQGMGKGFPDLIINLLRIFLIAIPLAYLFIFVLNYGFLSLAVAMVIAAAISAIISIIWLKIKFRKLN